MKKHNLTLAFTVRNFNTRQVLDDPSKVEWMAAIYEGDGNQDHITQ